MNWEAVTLKQTFLDFKSNLLYLFSHLTVRHSPLFYLYVERDFMNNAPTAPEHCLMQLKARFLTICLILIFITSDQHYTYRRYSLVRAYQFSYFIVLMFLKVVSVLKSNINSKTREIKIQKICIIYRPTDCLFIIVNLNSMNSM